MLTFSSWCAATLSPPCTASGKDSSPSTEQEPSTEQASGGESASSSSAAQTPGSADQPRRRSQKRQADSTDWISSQLTRRFGLAGGLAYLGFLTFGVVSEQIKTRLEVAADERGTRVCFHRQSRMCLSRPACISWDLSPGADIYISQDVEDAQEVSLPSGVRYTDLRIGGGQLAARGMLVILDLKLYANDELVQVSSPSCSRTCHLPRGYGP